VIQNLRQIAIPASRSIFKEKSQAGRLCHILFEAGIAPRRDASIHGDMPPR
jgi:homoaconitase/3-isopropylmalate dehydratase large subunit